MSLSFSINNLFKVYLCNEDILSAFLRWNLKYGYNTILNGKFIGVMLVALLIRTEGLERQGEVRTYEVLTRVGSGDKRLHEWLQKHDSSLSDT